MKIPSDSRFIPDEPSRAFDSLRSRFANYEDKLSWWQAAGDSLRGLNSYGRVLAWSLEPVEHIVIDMQGTQEPHSIVQTTHVSAFIMDTVGVVLSDRRVQAFTVDLANPLFLVVDPGLIELSFLRRS